MNKDNHGSVATYVIIALILGAITYVEFAIVEYEIAWLSRNAVMFWLVLLSVIKFVLVVMFFMHLKDDDKVYTGFFGSGMLLAMGTFVGLIFLFTAASTSNFTWTNQSPPQEAEQVADSTTPGPADQSSQPTPPAAGEADDFAVGPDGEAVPTTVASFDRAAAEAVYTASCASCHQAAGTGLPGVFPPLADNVNHIYDAGGRDVLMHTVLFGLSGPIAVHGQTYNGVMPAWQQLSDADISGVLNHIVTAWGNEAELDSFEPYSADEVAGARGLGLSSSDVHDEREALDLSESAGPAPDGASDEAEATVNQEMEGAAIDGDTAEDAGEQTPANQQLATEDEEAETEEQTEPAEEDDAGEAEPAPGAVADFDRAAAEAAYTTNCSSCHQVAGTGLPSIFPPLADNVNHIYNAGGRDVLLHTVLFGLAGSIEVHGQTYNGVMPAWQQLSDDDVAGVLNHIVTAWGNEDELEGFEPYTAAESEEARDLDLSPSDVYEERQALDLDAAGATDAADATDEAEASDEADAEAAEAAGEEAAAVADEAAADEAAAEDTAADEAAEEEAATETVAADFDREAAEAAYMANCSSCHQATGAGLPGIFPPLAGNVNHIYNAGGREVIAHTLLYGLAGQIEVQGQTYNGVMPAWQQVSDEDLAGIYNHILTAWGNEDELEGFEPMTADEMAAERGLDLSASDVYEERQALPLD